MRLYTSSLVRDLWAATVRALGVQLRTSCRARLHCTTCVRGRNIKARRGQLVEATLSMQGRRLLRAMIAGVRGN